MKKILAIIITIAIGLLIVLLLVFKFQIPIFKQASQSNEQTPKPESQKPQPSVGPDTTVGCIIDKTLSLEELINASTLIVAGTVEKITSVKEDRNIYSTITVTVEESFKKPMTDSVQIKTLGGTVEGITQVTGCQPQFTEKQEVLVFLVTNPKDPKTYTVYGGLDGKFKVEAGQASRGLPGEKPKSLDSIKATIKKITGSQSQLQPFWNKLTSYLASYIWPSAQAYSVVQQSGQTVMWFSQPVLFYMQNVDYSSIGPATHTLVKQSYDSWNSSGAPITISDAGVTNLTTPGQDAQNQIFFQDALNIVPAGARGYTSFWYGGSQKTINGTVFNQMLEADIVIKEGLPLDATNFQAFITHELGHGIGLGHSLDSQAIMYGGIILPYRTTLLQDDIDGVKFIYSPELYIKPSIILTPSNPINGDSLTFEGSGDNQGGTPAAPFWARFCIDNPNCFSNASGIFFNIFLNQSTDNGGGFWFKTDPWTAVTGNHTIYFCVDTQNSVAESNETNNCYSQNFTVDATAIFTSCSGAGVPRADLLVTTPSLSGKFFSKSGTCIHDSPDTTFDTADLPNYDLLLKNYYTNAKSTKVEVTGSSLTIQDQTVYHSANDLSVTSVSGSGVGLVFVDKNLEIASDILYGSCDSAGKCDVTSGVVFVVKGNVYIKPTVTKVNAVIIAEGRILTAASLNGSCDPNVFTPTLTINGSLISINPSTPVNLCRNKIDNRSAAEVVNHQAKYLVLLKNIFSDTQQKWQEIVELPTLNILPFYPAPIIDLRANNSAAPITINSGQSVTLSWTTTNSPTLCNASGSWTGSRSTTGGSEITGSLSGPNTYTYTLTCSNLGGQNSASVTVAVNPPPPTVTLTANGSIGTITIDHNQAAQLAWTTTNSPTSCTATAAPSSTTWTGSKSTSGGSESTGALAGPNTYTYTIKCDNAGGSATSSVTVNVTQPAPKVTIKANNQAPTITVAHGSTVTISWTIANNPKSCSASGAWSGAKSITGGNELVGPLSGPGSYTYTLTCSSGGKSGFDSVTVEVTPPAPTVNIKANTSDVPITVNNGSSVTISWTTTNSPTSCTASGSWSGAKSTTGGTEITPSLSGPATLTYTISCSNATGSSAPDSVTVNVNPPPPTVILKANNSTGSITIESGQSAQLSWATTNSTSCTSGGAWGTVSKPTSSLGESTGALTGPGSYGYTITCSNTAGSDSSSVTVNINAPPLTAPTLTGFYFNYSCYNHTTTDATITWTGTPMSSSDSCPNGFWVDISTDPNFGWWWFNCVVPTNPLSYATLAPGGFYLFPNWLNPAYTMYTNDFQFRANTLYHTRVFNGLESNTVYMITPSQCYFY